MVRRWTKEEEKEFRGYQELIDRVRLPPRFAAGDRRNRRRRKAVGKMMHRDTNPLFLLGRIIAWMIERFLLWRGDRKARAAESKFQEEEARKAQRK